MTAQPLLQFGTVTLNPTPDRRVIRLQTAFGEQLFDIAERERVPKIPAHGTKNQLRCRLPPLEDCRSGYVLHGLFRLPATPAKVATHPIRQQTESSPRGSDRSAPLDVGGRSWRERPGNHFEARESITFLTQAKSRNCALSVLDEGTRRVWVPLSIRHGFDATPK